jgi:hypothetical protein
MDEHPLGHLMMVAVAGLCIYGWVSDYAPGGRFAILTPSWESLAWLHFYIFALGVGQSLPSRIRSPRRTGRVMLRG